mgnify:FL=1
MGVSEDMKKIMLAGIGAVATTVEKSQDLVDKLIEKGELTVEQGKAINEELKRKKKSEDRKQKQQTEKATAIIEQLENLSEEELAAVKKKLSEME